MDRGQETSSESGAASAEQTANDARAERTESRSEASGWEGLDPGRSVDSEARREHQPASDEGSASEREQTSDAAPEGQGGHSVPESGDQASRDNSDRDDPSGARAGVERTEREADSAFPATVDGGQPAESTAAAERGARSGRSEADGEGGTNVDGTVGDRAAPDVSSVEGDSAASERGDNTALDTTDDMADDAAPVARTRPDDEAGGEDGESSDPSGDLTAPTENRGETGESDETGDSPEAVEVDDKADGQRRGPTSTDSASVVALGDTDAEADEIDDVPDDDGQAVDRSVDGLRPGEQRPDELPAEKLDSPQYVAVFRAPDGTIENDDTDVLGADASPPTVFDDLVDHPALANTDSIVFEERDTAGSGEVEVVQETSVPEVHYPSDDRPAHLDEPTTEIYRTEGDRTLERPEQSEPIDLTAPGDDKKTLERAMGVLGDRKNINDLSELGNRAGDTANKVLAPPRPTGSLQVQREVPQPVDQSPKDALDGSAVMIAPVMFSLVSYHGVRKVRDSIRSRVGREESNNNASE